MTGAFHSFGGEDPTGSPDEDLSSKRFYQQHGWVKLPALLAPAEVVRLCDIVQEAERREELKPKASGARPEQASAEYGRVMRILRGLWHFYPEVESIARRIGRRIGYLNGWDETRLWQDRVFTKPGSRSGSRNTNWHQDVKLPFDRRGFATAWIALVDIPKTRGPLTFLNGSHRLGSLGAIEQLDREYDLSELLTEDDWALVNGCSSAAPLRAGDASVHSMYTLHRAGENLDEEDRVVLAISYFDGRQLYNGSPNPVTDELGLTVGQPFNHVAFPIVAST